MNKGIISIAALVAAAVLFVAGNILAGTMLRGAKVDLTEGDLYTLSEGSRKIARGLKEPVRLTLFFSESTSNEAVQFKSYATRVKELLKEYEQASNGKIRLEFVNPEPFSEAEDRANQSGIVGVPISATERMYFGLLGVNSTDQQETIPFFDPGKESFLEYDLTRLIYLLSSPAKKTVGVMSWLPVHGMPFNPVTGQRGGTPPWQILTLMQDVFDVRTIETTVNEIPADINVLMVVHPKNPSPAVQYAIDQFVLRGGRLLLFVDPLCEGDVPPGIDRMQAMSLPKNSNLPTLMKAWGLELAEGKVAGDLNLGYEVGVGSQANPELVKFLPYMLIRDPTGVLDEEDPAMAGIRTLFLIMPGVLNPVQGAGTEFTPLVHTTPQSTEIDAAELSFVPDPKGLLAKFKAGEKPLTMAARVKGTVKTAFPDGPPAPTGPHLTESKEPANIVVVADCDMLRDQFWIQRQTLGPIDLGSRKVTDNGDLVIGILDHLGGTSDLQSLRARGTFARPFLKVEEIQNAAKAQYAARQDELQNKLRETEAEINKIQQTRPDGQASMLLTPEQQAKLEDFQKQRVATRKELRNVQHQLRKDIERLSSSLKFANMAIMPGAVALVAVGLGAYRAGRRRTDRMKQTVRS